MKKLSKYALKQLTPSERADYENECGSMESNTTHCYGGKVIVEDLEDGWEVIAIDDDGDEIDNRWCDTRFEAEEWIVDFVNALEEYADYDEESDYE